jgi:hypothetical protein
MDGVRGPQGERGEPGRDGRDGTNGKDGADGKDGRDGRDGLNGYTAYEIALSEGFEGTLEDWFLSLKGDTPDHKWEGTKLVFEKPDGSWGKPVDLRGHRGTKSSGGTTFKMDQLTPSKSDSLPTEVAVKQDGKWVRMPMAEFANIVINSSDLALATVVTAEE